MSEDYLFPPELISERLSNCCNFPRSKIESPSVSIIAKVFHFRYGVHAYTRTKQLLGFWNSPSFSNSVQFATAAINLPIAAVVSRRGGEDLHPRRQFIPQPFVRCVLGKRKTRKKRDVGGCSFSSSLCSPFFSRLLNPTCKSETTFARRNKSKKRRLEAPGIDPGTSRMLSERSTI